MSECSPLRRLREWYVGTDARLQWLVVALLCVLLGVDLVRVWSITNHKDADVYIRAGHRLARGESLYLDEAAFRAAVESGSFDMKDDSVVWPYANTPSIAILFAVTNGLTPRVVWEAWWFLNVAGLLGGSWLFLAAFGRVTPARIALMLLCVYRFEPAVAALRLGQVEIVQYLCLAAVLYALSRGREGQAGVFLGLASCLKILPLALGALLLWWRRWRAAACALGLGLFVLLGSFAIVGFDSMRIYLEYARMYGITGAFSAFPFNQSINGVVTRNLVKNAFSPSLAGLNMPALAKGLVLALDVIVVGASAWLTWRRKRWNVNASDPYRARLGLEYCFALVAMLLVSPHSQVYTLTWTMATVVCLALWHSGGGRSSCWEWIGLALAYVLVGRNYVLFVPGITRFVQAHYFLGMVLLWVLSGVALYRSSGDWADSREPRMRQPSARSPECPMTAQDGKPSGVSA